MRIHILGICGTFMGGFAQIAKTMGHKVSGCDANVYPPMSDQLQSAGIELIEGYDVQQLEIQPDLWIIGNAISRGNPLLEAILNSNQPYMSAPQWLGEYLLPRKKVLAVAGTHGKTTTTSMLTWILEYAGLHPGFLVGGVPGNFQHSARYSDSPFFVIEADEYDTAFFDKRSKFVHYRPYTAILNNLEYDHADIFPDIDAIKRQFHHLVRTIPSMGHLVVNAHSETLKDVLDMGCWSPVEFFSTGEIDSDWKICFSETSKVFHENREIGSVALNIPGEHNRLNALAAIVAASTVGVPPEKSIEALSHFCGVKKRLEFCGEVHGVKVVDDFAHHPTAISETLRAQREIQKQGRILVVFEPRSNTMKLGTMKEELPLSFALADKVFCYQSPSVKWDVSSVMAPMGEKVAVFQDLASLVSSVVSEAKEGDTLLVMSNGGFGGVQKKLLKALEEVKE